MKLRFVVALGLLVASVAASGQAGFGGPQTTVPLTATYRIQPEDILRVQVFNMPQTAADVVVGRDGNITAPFTGIVRAAGKTTSELEEELRNKYIEKLRLRDPVVSVTIIRFRAVRATVGGAVIRGDVYELRPGDTLLSLLNRGGGADMTRADLRRATLRRAGSSELIPVDLYAMLVQGDTSQNFEIQDGDELSVPEERRRNRIDIQGAVQAPEPIPIESR